MSHLDTDNIVYVSCVQGDTLRLTVDLDAATGEVDITGWEWKATVRHPGTDALTPMTINVTGPTEGILEISLSPAQTAALAPGDFDWDLEATDTNADVRTLVLGQLRIREDVSP